MRNLPLTKDFEKLLRLRGAGVWNVKGKGQYLKSTSELDPPIVKIPCSKYKKKALKDAMLCAKVYKRLIDVGMYHPETKVLIYKDDRENLSLMILMPELREHRGEIKDRLEIEKVRSIERKLGLETKLDVDVYIGSNWGYDKKTGEMYAHDLHIAKDYKAILNLAQQMGIK